MTQSTNVPSWDRAAADAWAERRHAEHAISRAASGIIDGTIDLVDYEALVQERGAAAARVESLLYANAAHELDWCHDSTECAICTGEVTR
jgi:hypothetical protein